MTSYLTNIDVTVRPLGIELCFSDLWAVTGDRYNPKGHF